MNNYLFSTTKTIPLTRLSVMLYVHDLSCRYEEQQVQALANKHTHTHHRFRICRQTPTTHLINICEPLQAISVKVQVITP